MKIPTPAYELGIKVKDKITGFTGVLTSFNYAIGTGVPTYSIQPEYDNDGKLEACVWVPESRIEVIICKPIDLGFIKQGEHHASP